MSAWISVKDRLPAYNVPVLINSRGFVVVGVLVGVLKTECMTNFWLGANGEFTPGHVTHWQPLPEPPEER